MDQIIGILNDLTVVSVKPRTQCKLLLKRNSDPCRIRPALNRTWQQVDSGCRELLNRLAGGSLPWPLYLHGPVGVGKTRAVFAFADALNWARYWTVSEVMELMILKKTPWAEWREGPALTILDELGIHVAKDFEYDAVKRFLDWREDRPAIYISNHPANGMRQSYDERIASRLTCGTVYHLQGPDRRKQRNEGRVRRNKRCFAKQSAAMPSKPKALLGRERSEV